MSWEFEQELLDDAILKLEWTQGLVRPVRVQWGQGFQSRTSTIVPVLFIDASGTRVNGFYKRLHLLPQAHPDPRPSNYARLTLGLEVSHRYGEMIRSSGIRIDEVLAADAERGLVVTMEVPGRPMGRAIKWALTYQRRRQIIDAMRRLGQAVSELEVLAEGHGIPDDDLEWRPLELSLERLKGWLPDREIAATETIMGRLYDSARTPRVGTTFSHGDLSSSNILIGEELGIIDFGWVPRIRGYDLATYSYRLDYETPGQQRWVEHLKDAIFDTYDCAETVDSPSWTFVRLRRILGMVAKYRFDLRHRWRVVRGLEEVRLSL